MSVGERLKILKKSTRLNFEEFAELLGVSNTTVLTYYKNKVKPSFDSVYRIREKYPNFNIDWLMFGEGEMFKGSNLESNTVNNAPGGSIGVMGVGNSGDVVNKGDILARNNNFEKEIAELKAENKGLKAQLEAKEEIIATLKDMIEMMKGK